MNAREKFYKENEHITTNKFELEMLYAQKMKISKLEAIRSNSSKIVWFIVIQIILAIILALTISSNTKLF